MIVDWWNTKVRAFFFKQTWTLLFSVHFGDVFISKVSCTNFEQLLCTHGMKGWIISFNLLYPLCEQEAERSECTGHRVVFPAASPHMMHEKEAKAHWHLGINSWLQRNAKVEETPAPLPLQLINLCSDEREGQALRPDPQKLALIVTRLISSQFHDHEAFSNNSISLFSSRELTMWRGHGLPCRYKGSQCLPWFHLHSAVLGPETI